MQEVGKPRIGITQWTDGSKLDTEDKRVAVI